MATTSTTTDALFAADVLASRMPVLVDFTAAWCPPCQMIAPVLEQIAVEQADRLRVVSVDVDDNPVVAEHYQIVKMPTLILFVNGTPVTRSTGAQARTVILAELEPHLGPTRTAQGRGTG
jgi:thioredoxin 1